MEKELHDLSQPLTSLQCRLEIGLLVEDETSAREVLEDCLLELKRVLAAVSRMRTVLAANTGEGGSV